MQILLNILLLLVGFAGLIKGADWFVDGSSGVAKKLKVPSVIIGLTIVAMGTSAPELAVSVAASFKRSSEIAVSNVVGSNIFNLLMVLGICAVISNVPMDKGIMKRDFPFYLFLLFLLLALTSGGFIASGKLFKESPEVVTGKLSRIHGIIFLALFVVYIIFLVMAAKKNKLTDDTDVATMSYIKCAVLIAVGIACIVLGGKFVVSSAKYIAKQAGLSETLIGLTIVAVGTSLPELVTSIVASKKGENGLAVGNAVGSCIFNILLILGCAATIRPLNINMASVYDMIILLVISIVTYVFAITDRGLSRKEGIALVIMYVAEIAFAVVR